MQEENNVDIYESIIEEGEFTPSIQYIPKSEKEIKDIATGIYKNTLFSSMQINENDKRLILNIFMPLAFLSPLDRKQLIIDNIAQFYGELAGSTTAINGYPVLFNCRPLTQEDANRVIEKYKKIIEILEDNDG